ncbi:MAG TPA: S53 family peptidase [Terriglobia bacterium]|nr:S53 family peptidase [Terriglobia bacterium]
MRRMIGFLVMALAVMPFSFPVSTMAQSGEGLFHGAQGHVVIPLSNNHTAADTGVRAHTNVRLFVPDKQITPDELPPYAGYAFETPASLACLYGLAPALLGCNPNSTTANPGGGSQTIAIVDAYDYPEAASDLAVFSAQFGLPTPTASNFTVVYASGHEPPVDPTGGWEGEEALDIEQAHAFAPYAHIYLVEANSGSNSDLYPAVNVATNLVICGDRTCPHGGNGQGEVSMGWGASEWSQEYLNDYLFNHEGVVYFAAAGDEAGVEYPCVSPNVVCVGGTSTARSIFTGNFLYQVAWQDASGGFSSYEPRPSYQNSISAIVGPTRGVPDLSFDANASTGVWNYDSVPFEYAPGEFAPGGWSIAGGTSVGSPSVAGIVNAAGHFYGSSFLELETIYSNRSKSSDFTDITLGTCGPYISFTATPGWDFCTGVGTPYGYKGK